MPSLEELFQGRLDLRRLGSLWLVWNDQGLVAVRWNEGGPMADVQVRKRLPTAYTAPLRDLDRGRPVDLARIPIVLGGTPFQRKVWQALRRIPAGRVRTYAGVAKDIGNPRSTRAVGMANGANRLPIVVPCHRVVSAGSTLGGYSGGIERKRLLLELEGVEFEGDLVLPGQLTLF
ncbi:MAG: methylated-DNA--[protein]-cysteine S-methyltransferase [Myxococcota bacterium]